METTDLIAREQSLKAELEALCDVLMWQDEEILELKCASMSDIK